ncbi:MAG TPA: hypothetical protein VHE55_10505 [Fimbriimonadaceae bacterium]|nr:hypothetical protein [Fimbriimonadaceae bacterium]
MHVASLYLSGKIDFLLRGKQLGAPRLAHPHLEFFGIIVDDDAFFFGFVFRVEFQEIVVSRFGGRIVQKWVCARFDEGMPARRADSDGAAPSWLLD